MHERWGRIFGALGVCLWLSLPAALAASGAGPAERASAPHIVLILIDTLRADHLGAYGYARDTSPALDALADEGLLFENLYSTSSWTNPAIVTLFSGRYPQSVLPPARHSRAIRQALPTSLTTLAEALRDGGYRTVALVDHPGINRKLHFDQGFETFIRLFEKSGRKSWTRTDGEFVYAEVDAQLRAMNGSAPAFLYLHLIYPHRPYAPPPPYDAMFGPPADRATRTQRDRVVNSYDGEIRYTDALVGRIVDRMRALALLDRSIVIVTSDHGEAFWEHGMSQHGNSFYDELVRVPLIIRPPAEHPMARGRTAGLASALDLYPTVLQLAGIEAPDGIDARPLLRADGSLRAPRDAVFSESPHQKDVTAAASIGARHKYIRSGRWRHELYDRVDDPAETDNRLLSVDLLRGDWWRLREALAAHRDHTERVRRTLESESVEPDSDTQRRLRALGYVD